MTTMKPFVKRIEVQLEDNERKKNDDSIEGNDKPKKKKKKIVKAVTVMEVPPTPLKPPPKTTSKKTPTSTATTKEDGMMKEMTKHEKIVYLKKKKSEQRRRAAMAQATQRIEIKLDDNFGIKAITSTSGSQGNRKEVPTKEEDVVAPVQKDEEDAVVGKVWKDDEKYNKFDEMDRLTNPRQQPPLQPTRREESQYEEVVEEEPIRNPQQPQPYRQQPHYQRQPPPPQKAKKKKISTPEKRQEQADFKSRLFDLGQDYTKETTGGDYNPTNTAAVSVVSGLVDLKEDDEESSDDEEEEDLPTTPTTQYRRTKKITTFAMDEDDDEDITSDREHHYNETKMKRKKTKKKQKKKGVVVVFQEHVQHQQDLPDEEVSRHVRGTLDMASTPSTATTANTTSDDDDDDDDANYVAKQFADIGKQLFVLYDEKCDEEDAAEDEALDRDDWSWSGFHSVAGVSNASTASSSLYSDGVPQILSSNRYDKYKYDDYIDDMDALTTISILAEEFKEYMFPSRSKTKYTLSNMLGMMTGTVNDDRRKTVDQLLWKQRDALVPIPDLELNDDDEWDDGYFGLDEQSSFDTNSIEQLPKLRFHDGQLPDGTRITGTSNQDGTAGKIRSVYFQPTHSIISYITMDHNSDNDDDDYSEDSTNRKEDKVIEDDDDKKEAVAGSTKVENTTEDEELVHPDERIIVNTTSSTVDETTQDEATEMTMMKPNEEQLTAFATMYEKNNRLLGNPPSSFARLARIFTRKVSQSKVPSSKSSSSCSESFPTLQHRHPFRRLRGGSKRNVQDDEVVDPTNKKNTVVSTTTIGQESVPVVTEATKEQQEDPPKDYDDEVDSNKTATLPATKTDNADDGSSNVVESKKNPTTTPAGVGVEDGITTSVPTEGCKKDSEENEVAILELPGQERHGPVIQDDDDASADTVVSLSFVEVQDESCQVTPPRVVPSNSVQELVGAELGVEKRSVKGGNIETTISPNSSPNASPSRLHGSSGSSFKPVLVLQEENSTTMPLVVVEHDGTIAETDDTCIGDNDDDPNLVLRKATSIGSTPPPTPPKLPLTPKQLQLLQSSKSSVSSGNTTTTTMTTMMTSNTNHWKTSSPHKKHYYQYHLPPNDLVLQDLIVPRTRNQLPSVVMEDEPFQQQDYNSGTDGNNNVPSSLLTTMRTPNEILTTNEDDNSNTNSSLGVLYDAVKAMNRATSFMSSTTLE